MHDSLLSTFVLSNWEQLFGSRKLDLELMWQLELWDNLSLLTADHELPGGKQWKKSSDQFEIIFFF